MEWGNEWILALYPYSIWGRGHMAILLYFPHFSGYLSFLYSCHFPSVFLYGQNDMLTSPILSCVTFDKAKHMAWHLFWVSLPNTLADKGLACENLQNQNIFIKIAKKTRKKWVAAFGSSYVLYIMSASSLCYNNIDPAVLVVAQNFATSWQYVLAKHFREAQQ